MAARTGILRGRCLELLAAVATTTFSITALPAAVADDGQYRSHADCSSSTTAACSLTRWRWRQQNEYEFHPSWPATFN